MFIEFFMKWKFSKIWLVIKSRACSIALLRLLFMPIKDSFEIIFLWLICLIRFWSMNGIRLIVCDMLGDMFAVWFFSDITLSRPGSVTCHVAAWHLVMTDHLIMFSLNAADQGPCCPPHQAPSSGLCCKAGGCPRPRSRYNSPRSRQFLKMMEF